MQGTCIENMFSFNEADVNNANNANNINVDNWSGNEAILSEQCNAKQLMKLWLCNDADYVVCGLRKTGITESKNCTLYLHRVSQKI